MDLESLDIIIVVVLIVGLVRGVATGAVRQVASFVGTIVAIVLGIELMAPVGDALGVGESLEPVVGFVVVFAVVQLTLIFLVRMVETAINVVKLNPLNRLVGGVVGTGKAALLLSVLFLVLGFFEMPERENRDASTLYEPVASVFPRAWDYLAARLPHVRNLSDRFGKEVEDILSDRRTSSESS